MSTRSFLAKRLSKRRVSEEAYEKPPKATSERMRKVRSRGTSLEKAMEKILKKLKVKYEKQPKLLGRPDFRITGTNVLIFCDGSFWHGRRQKDVTGRAFRKNRGFWVKKLTGNRKRDQRINRTLLKAGWRVLRFWDTLILERAEYVTNSIKRRLDASNG